MQKNLKFLLITLSILFFISVLTRVGFADPKLKLDVVYPANNAIIKAKSTFFIGSTEKDAKLTINKKAVKVFSNGSFVEVVNLNEGENTVLLTSTLNRNSITKTYKLTRKLGSDKLVCPVKSEDIEIPLTLACITAKQSVVRAFPDGDRLTPLPEGTLLILTAQKGDNYRFKLGNCTYGWIKKSDVKLLPNQNLPALTEIKTIDIIKDNTADFIKIPLQCLRLPFSLTETADGNLTLDIFGANAANCVNTSYQSNFIKNINYSNLSPDVFRLQIAVNSNQLWGYDYFYEGNNLVLKLNRKPEIDCKNPLKGLTIAIDAGHGGNETGSVGPTGVPEKEINLKISNYLKQELEKSGAKVIMIRDSDKYVDLYDRVKIARENNALILVSVHNNALPDGEDPYQIHGTCVYYYHPQALPLATAIQKSLIKDLKLKNLGTKHGSFVLTRPTSSISVLIETAFMINPYEYEKLLKPVFQKQAAFSIKKGLEDFVKKQANLTTEHK